MLGNIFILGDSYSTYKGYLPEKLNWYYSDEGPNYAHKYPELASKEKDVCDVTQTWWYNFTKENGVLIRNCSWSGTTICNTGYDGKDYSYCSFITRIEELLKSGYFENNKVDTLLLFGGTNDSWSDAPLGEAKSSSWTKDDLYFVLPAFSYLIDLLTKKIPEAKIYCILNDELKPEITNFYKKTCDNNGVEYIELNGIDKVSGHPTILGMKQIREQVEAYIKNK